MRKLLLENANILTMDPARPRATGLLVQQGRIAAVGGDLSALAGAQGALRVNLQGRTVLPGFVDGHSHLVQNARTLLYANARPAPAGCCNSLSSLVASLRRQLADWLPAHAPGDWFIAIGFDESVYPERRPPTRRELDSVSPTVPICLTHASGHAAVFNSAALALCGIDQNYRCPAGGAMPRLPGSQEYSGLLQENAFFAQTEKLPRPTLRQALAALRRSAAQYAAFGVTTAQEAKVTAADLPLLRAARLLHLLPLDLALYFAPETAQSQLPRRHPAQNAYQGHIRPAGCKLFLDGSPQAKTAWLSQPYAVPPPGEAPTYRGFAAMTDQALLGHIVQCLANRWQLHVHANGDEAIEQFIRCYGKALARCPGAPALRPTIIHCQTARPDQLTRMAQLGICASFFADHVYYWGDYHRQSVLGAPRAQRISPVASALALGVPSTLHQDTPVAPPNMLLSVQNAVCRRTRSGAVLGEAERLTVEQALACVTRSGAYQLFEEARKGSLTPGRDADLVVLAQDPTRVPARQIAQIPILATIKAGRVIYAAK